MGARRAIQFPCRISALPIRFGLALLAVVVLSTVWSPVASAVPYKVEVCTRPSTAPDGIPSTAAEGVITETVGESGPLFVKNCDVDAPGSGAIHQGSFGGTAKEFAEGFWGLFAPEHTRILTVELTQSFHRTIGNPSFLKYRLLTGSGSSVFSYTEDGRIFFPSEERKTYTVNSGSFFGSMFCFGLTAGVCSGGEFTATFQDIFAELDDELPPQIGTPALPPGALRRVVGVNYSATDPGSGLADAALIVDGQRQQSFHDDNGGHCQQPYKYVAPCRHSVEASLPLDTTSLSEGRHQVAVAVVDATGQETVSAPVDFIVHNAPVNTAPPVIRGTETVGSRLTAEVGRWAGDPTYAFQWMRCPAGIGVEGDTNGCAPIAGATSQDYVLGRDDLQHRELVEITATNAAGSGSAITAASEVISEAGRRLKPPVLSHVTLSRQRFRVGGSSAASKRGAILSFSCSKAGHLALIVERVRGKKAKPISKLAAAIKSGRSSVLLTGEIGTRRLAAGKYRVTIRVRDAKGAASDAVSVPFTILPG